MDDGNYEEKEPGEGLEPGRGSAAPLRSRTPWNTVGGRVISLVSRKGGVGKTTSAVNLGAALALNGHTVLVIGTDPQCGVCRTLGTQPLELSSSLNDIFVGDDETGGQNLTDLALTSPLDHLYFVSPRIITLADEEQYLTNLAEHTYVFVREIDRARNLYDTILIDCPPSLGPATRAALLASDSYLVPVQAEELCRESIESLLEFVETFKSRSYPDLDVEHLVDDLPNPLSLEGLFLTMASERTRMGRHVAARVSEDFGALVFDTGIPRTTRLSEMALRGKPTVIYDRRSAGSRAYFDLADELVNRYSSGGAANDSLIDAMIASMGRSLDMESFALPTVPGASALAGTPPEPETTDHPEIADSPAQVVYEEPETPEMVSLDDLLAEEENRNDKPADDEWEEGYWSGDFGSRGRLN